MSTSAPREFSHKGNSLVFQIITGCIFGMVGLGFTLFSVLGVVLAASGGNVSPVFFIGFLVGPLLLLLAVGAPLAMGYFGTNTRIVCGEEGFSITTESKRAGKQHSEYRWDEVTGTDYDESTFRSSQSGTQTTRFFTVETARGRAFQVTQKIRGFQDLIQLFNQMTPHLPYTWEKQTGFNVSIGSVSAGRHAFRKVARSEASAQP
jgi:hypothetical protein